MGESTHSFLTWQAFKFSTPTKTFKGRPLRDHGILVTYFLEKYLIGKVILQMDDAEIYMCGYTRILVFR